jgi:hypothetical protein
MAVGVGVGVGVVVGVGAGVAAAAVGDLVPCGNGGRSSSPRLTDSSRRGSTVTVIRATAGRSSVPPGHAATPTGTAARIPAASASVTTRRAYCGLLACLCRAFGTCSSPLTLQGTTFAVDQATTPRRRCHAGVTEPRRTGAEDSGSDRRDAAWGFGELRQGACVPSVGPVIGMSLDPGVEGPRID